jgi:hypothetical protein
LRDFKGLRRHLRVGLAADDLDHRIRLRRKRKEQISLGETNRFAKEPLSH